MKANSLTVLKMEGANIFKPVPIRPTMDNGDKAKKTVLEFLNYHKNSIIKEHLSIQ